MVKVLTDLEKLTGIKTSIINKLSSCVEYVIVDNITESMLSYEENTQTELDLGFGILTIVIIDDTIRYLFKPSNKLENGIINAVNNNENILENKLKDSINSHIYKSYKDMF